MRINNLEDLETITATESPDFKGFYIFPFNNDLLVSKDGKFINARTGNLLKQQLDSKKRRYRLNINYGGSIKNYIVSRVLAITFIGRPSRHLDKDYSRLEVNHVNGIKTDNDLNNLEWCTCKENMTHAHLYNLYPNDIPTLSRNLITDEIKRFNSVEACANHYDISKATLWEHLAKKKSGLKQKGNCIFKFDDGKDWYINNTNILELGISCNPIKVIAKNVFNNDIKVFNSLKECSKYFDINHSTLWRILTKGIKCLYHKDFYVLKLNDGSDWKKFPLSYLKEIGDHTISSDVVIEDTINNKITIMSGIEKASKYLQIREKRINKALKHNKEFKYKEFIVRKLKDVLSTI